MNQSQSGLTRFMNLILLILLALIIFRGSQLIKSNQEEVLKNREEILKNREENRKSREVNQKLLKFFEEKLGPFPDEQAGVAQW